MTARFEGFFMMNQAASRLPQLSLAFKEFDENFPLRSVFLDVGLNMLVIYELDGVTVIQIVLAILHDLAFYLTIAEY